MSKTTWYAQGNLWERVGKDPIVPPAPTSEKPVIGAATQSDSQASFSSLESQVGTLLMRRCYTNDGVFPASFAASSAAIDTGVRESMWSFKPVPSEFAAGNHDTWFNNFLDSVPSGQKVIFIMWHEPEDNIRDGEFTLADWKAANNRMGQLVHAKGRPELRTAICLLGAWTFDPLSPYYTNDYWDSGFTANIDFVGFDPYSSDGNFTLLENDPNFMTAMNWANVTHGKQVILPEFGCSDDPGGDPTKKADWITDTYQSAISMGMYSICYFNLDVSIQDVELITPEAIAAFSSVNADSKV